MRSPLLALPLGLLLAGTLHAQSAAPASPDSGTAPFARQLLRAMSFRDIDALAAMFRFPAAVHAGGGVVLPVASRDALAKAFDTIFTPELGCAIERSLTAAGRSGSSGDAANPAIAGVVRLQRQGSSFVITRVDEPAGAAPAAPRPQPRRVDLPSGELQFAGTLAAGGADRYLVAVRQGDRLQARIERFQGPAAGVRIVDATTGRVVGSGAAAARVTSATAAGNATFAVEVTRLTFCDPAVSYLLTISKRR